MKSGVVYLVLGMLLELTNISNLLTMPFHPEKGTDYVIGEILFNIMLGGTGITLIIIGIIKLRKEKKSNY